MKALLLLAIGFLSVPHFDEVEVQIHYVRPSLIVARMAQMAEDAGALQPDDFKGVIRITGSEEDIARIKKFVAMFDVKPRKLVLKWTLKSEIDKFESQGQVTTGNNVKFSFTATELGSVITLQPRLIVERGRENEVSLRTTVRIEINNAIFTKDVESKSGIQTIVKLTEMKPIGEKATTAISVVDPRLWPELHLTVTFGG